MPNTSQSKPSPVTTTVPPCPPMARMMASTRPNHNLYVFICRLSVYAGGVASQTLELRLRGQGSVELTLWSERPTRPSPARPPCPKVPPCPPTASTHSNRNMYVFICRLSVHARGVASLETGARAPGQLGALASTDRTANTNSHLVRLGPRRTPKEPRQTQHPSASLTKVLHTCAPCVVGPGKAHGAQRSAPLGRVPLGRFETAGPARTDHPLELKLDGCLNFC